MSRYQQAVEKHLARHGVACVYKSIGQGAYNIETGTVTNTSTNYNIKAYPKHIKASQFNYPDLIGKQAIMFYVSATELTVTPKIRDSITYAGQDYNIDSFQSHVAEGQILLYRIIAVI